MFKQSPNIFHPQNDLFILTQFSIDFVISQKRKITQKKQRAKIVTSQGVTVEADMIEEAPQQVPKNEQKEANKKGWR